MIETSKDESKRYTDTDRTVQILCESIIPHISDGREEYLLAYRVTKKSSYDIIAPYHLNDAHIHVRKNKNNWVITATAINSTKIEEEESFKLSIPISSCDDLVKLARIYTIAWTDDRRRIYNEASRYLPHLYRLQQNTQSCSTD
nr:MAG TPA: hypothetical protein [Bacteriophage sp.]